MTRHPYSRVIPTNKSQQTRCGRFQEAGQSGQIPLGNPGHDSYSWVTE